MGNNEPVRQQLTRGVSVLLVALLAIAAIATGAAAGTYPPNPGVWGEISCQPEDVSAGDEVTCTVDGLDPEDGAEWYFDVQRHSDDDEAEVFSAWGDLDVAPDGTASFTVQIPAQGPDVGDQWFAYVHQRSDEDSCYALVVDNEGDVVEYLAGPAPFTWLDDEGTRFEMDGVEYVEGEDVGNGYVTVQCDGGFDAMVDGVIVASTTDAGNGATDNTTESGADTATEREVTPVAAETLPETGVGAVLLGLIGALSLLTGVGALRGPQLLARIRRS